METDSSMQLFIALCQIAVSGAVTYVLYRIYLSYTRNVERTPSVFENKVERVHRNLVESEYKGSNTFLYDYFKVSFLIFASALFISLGLHAFGYARLIPYMLGGFAAPWIYITIQFTRDRISFNKKRKWIQTTINKKVDKLVTDFWKKD